MIEKVKRILEVLDDIIQKQIFSPFEQGFEYFADFLFDLNLHFILSGDLKVFGFIGFVLKLGQNGNEGLIALQAGVIRLDDILLLNNLKLLFGLVLLLVSLEEIDSSSDEVIVKE